MINTKPCGLCKHLDEREKGQVHYCWAHLSWNRTNQVVRDCMAYERADGQPSPRRLVYKGEQA